jgi:predicted dehydrogenase
MTVRYAVVGTGSRAQVYLEAFGRFGDPAELVAWSDPNPGRLDYYERLLASGGMASPIRFAPEELAETVKRSRIDRVIVTSPDHTHAALVVAALDAGAGAIVEKPLAVSEAGIKQIAEAAGRSEQEVVVTFNYRYSPRNFTLRQVIASGAIGRPTSVHFEWLLDTAHGADYFRRWHRQKANSGGLLVHKASHHFDLVNWWIADTPVRVFAGGGLRFYGAEAAARRGLGPRPERGSTDSPLKDRFSLDLRTDPRLRALYYDQEHHDGYRRDRDVFDPGIDIEDNLSLVVDYRSGTTMSYSLNAHSPWEGYTVAINGTRGRAELTVVESGRPVSETLILQRHFETAEQIGIPSAGGGHGGGDDRLLQDLFAGRIEPDPLQRAAGWRDGVRSVAVGLAANRSLDTGQAVHLRDLELGSVDLGL